nr:hypothetical protein [Tanacetum cinerariifolium]
MVSKFEAQELEINSLKAKNKLLEDKDRGVADQSGDDALIKGWRLDEGEEAAERVSDDTEEMATVLTSIDAATSGGVQVVPTAAEVATATVSIPTGSGVVSTASPTIPTASPIFTTATDSTPYTRRKEKKRWNNETVAKYLQEYYQFATEFPIERRIELISDLVKYQDHYAKTLKYQTQQRKPLSRKQQKEFYMLVLKSHAVKRIFRYLKGHLKLGLWYLKESPFDLVAYSDSDYVGATQDHKSTTGGCQFLGGRLISWQCKKHTIMATSTTEAEYVASASGCGQVLWIQNQLLDYGDCFEKNLISVDHIHTDENVADLLTKPFDAGRFKYLVGEGSGTPTEPHHTPSPEAQQTSPTTHSSPSLPPVLTESLPPVIPTDTPPLRHYTKRARIAQSLGLPPVVNKPASPIGDVSQGKACPTNSGLEADQDRVNIPKTSTLPSDSTPRVTSLAADEDTQELEINNLKARIKLLEDKERGVTDQSGDDASIKGKRLDKGEEAAERVNDDTEEIATVLISMDVASILTSGGVQVAPSTAEVATPTVSIPTGSGVVSTTNPIIPTASPIFTTTIESTSYTRRKARDAQRMNEQIAQDAEIARIHAKEELQMLIDGLDRNNETVPKYLQEYYQFATELPIERRIELINDLKFDPVWKQWQDFIPIGSKEEVERFKRKGLRLEQESVKKLKTSEEVKATEEVPEEKVKEMMQMVPVEEHFDREDLNQLLGLVKETLSIRPTTSASCVNKRPRYIHADIEGLPSEEGSGDYDDQLQASSEKLLSDGK